MNKLFQCIHDMRGVNVLDHIIVGKNPGDFYSFAREDLILN